MAQGIARDWGACGFVADDQHDRAELLSDEWRGERAGGEAPRHKWRAPRQGTGSLGLAHGGTVGRNLKGSALGSGLSCSLQLAWGP
jgi:hypothetical protein